MTPRVLEVSSPGRRMRRARRGCRRTRAGGSFHRDPRPRTGRSGQNPRPAEQQRQHSKAKGAPPQRQADNRIDDAEEDEIGPVGGKIIEAVGHDIAELGDANSANLGGPDVELLGPDPGAACRPDQPGELDLICCPFDGVADRHVRSSRTCVRGPRRSRERTPDPASGHAEPRPAINERIPQIPVRAPASKGLRRLNRGSVSKPAPVARPQQWEPLFVSVSRRCEGAWGVSGCFGSA